MGNQLRRKNDGTNALRDRPTEAGRLIALRTNALEVFGAQQPFTMVHRPSFRFTGHPSAHFRPALRDSSLPFAD